MALGRTEQRSKLGTFVESAKYVDLFRDEISDDDPCVSAGIFSFQKDLVL